MKPTVFFDEYIVEGALKKKGGSAVQDEKIVELYLARDQQAIKETQEKYHRFLLKLSYNILSDVEDSEESVNDTYLAAWNSIPPHIPSVLSSYLAKLTRRIAIDIFRKRNRGKRFATQYALSLTELDDCIADTNTPESQVDVKLLASAINAFLRTLDDDARNLFVGRYFFLDSLKKTAEYCGMTESRAKTLLFRTRHSLKSYLEKEGFDI